MREPRVWRMRPTGVSRCAPTSLGRALSGSAARRRRRPPRAGGECESGTTTAPRARPTGVRHLRGRSAAQWEQAVVPGHRPQPVAALRGRSSVGASHLLLPSRRARPRAEGRDRAGPDTNASAAVRHFPSVRCTERWASRRRRCAPRAVRSNRRAVIACIRPLPVALGTRVGPSWSGDCDPRREIPSVGGVGHPLEEPDCLAGDTRRSRALTMRVAAEALHVHQLSGRPERVTARRHPPRGSSGLQPSAVTRRPVGRVRRDDDEVRQAPRRAGGSDAGVFRSDHDAAARGLDASRTPIGPGRGRWPPPAAFHRARAAGHSDDAGRPWRQLAGSSLMRPRSHVGLVLHPNHPPLPPLPRTLAKVTRVARGRTLYYSEQSSGARLWRTA